MDDGKWGLVRDPVKVATCRMARKTLRAAHRKGARRVEFKEGSGEREVSDRVLRVSEGSKRASEKSQDSCRTTDGTGKGEICL